MGYDNDVVDLLELWEDDALPVRKRALNTVLEALGARDLAIRNVACVAGILGGAALVGVRDGVWCDIVAATPNLDLLIAILLGCLSLVEALEVAIVLLVEAPLFSTGIQSRSIWSRTLLRVLTARLRKEV